MKNDIDSKTILSVFEFVQKNGEQTQQGKHFQGLTAFSDFDGYTVYLQGSGVVMRYGFHNTYHLDYEHDKQKYDFLSKIEHIYKLAEQ
ncbi:hypothetical protein PCIT_b0603 [Pseudoalteromonas citrea]|uniref:DUF3081 domain-containing protein n=2 Tax=Pseudoalteromonas citrea TaxID=43655 RepID=A0AAD4FQ07_9GAMM|nr:DUF3081 family protein [Pseudoalteromonas citrea]KAF7764567.1 hypothetical protein PCIT_b0603 [Pseudoalteromonas citrea]